MTMAALLPEPPLATFRYVLPDGPVAGTAVDIGHVAVTIGLLLTGELEVGVGPGSEASGGLLAVAEDGLRGAALSALGVVAKGVMIRGLGSAMPSISSAAGHRFTQQAHDFRAPNTVTSSGDCDVDFTHQHDGVPATVRGQLTYELAVTAERPPSARAPQGWFRRHEKELASIGLLLLVAVPVAPGRVEKSPV